MNPRPRLAAPSGFAIVALVVACKTVKEEWQARAPVAAAKIEDLLSLEPPRPAPASVHEQRFDQIVSIYLETAFQFDPPRATKAGFHGRDRELGDLSKAGIEAAAGRLDRVYRDLETVDSRDLTGDRRIDRGYLANRIKADLHELREIRRWENDPNFYLTRASQGFFSLLARDFAPAPQRAAAFGSRVSALPALFSAARTNLKNPPKVWTEVAIDQTKGAIDYLETEATSAFPAGALEPDEETVYRAALGRAKEELEGYLAFLNAELLARSFGPYAIGERRFLDKLFLEEGLTIPLDRLLLIGEDEIARLEDRFAETAAKIAPGVPPNEVLARHTGEHPAADAVVSTTGAGLAELREFCAERKIVTFASEEAPIVRPTPAFARAYTFASMDSPGPFERAAREAFYSVTLPEPEASPARAEEQLKFFNRYSLPIVSIHEAYPGHFTQVQRMRELPSTVRRFLYATTNVEGWAHYCEEMLLDEGYGGDDPVLRLAQLRLALIRACRYVVGIRLHTKGMTLAEATRFFEEHAYLERANAEREAKRGTSDPTYLAYTLGKKMVLKLREDWRQKKGDAYSLGAFHDAFLSCGGPPLPIVRAILLPGDEGPAL